jgi:hypothetical protein
MGLQRQADGRNCKFHHSSYVRCGAVQLPQQSTTTAYRILVAAAASGDA